MRNIRILAVGNLKEGYWRSAAAEYEKRLGRFCRLTVTEIAEESTPEQSLKKEGERILAALHPDSIVVALCIEGRQTDSVAFSRLVADAMETGKRELVFVIGGSEGLLDAVKARADKKISFSPMTLPHQLARVILLEQLFRGFKIQAGEKYHK